jgi:AAA+ ATPase superfamily predicted ATPase
VRLGVVSGRRRQGKTFLLRALAESTGGFYFTASETTESDALREFASAIADHVKSGVPAALTGWDQALRHVYEVIPDRLIVIDEFPYLTKASPALPSLLQRALDPQGWAHRGSSARLLLCGSAMSVMGRLLSGAAPLRGRAGLELLIRPFDYRAAARFWGISDPRLAVLVHAVVGGTPAYRRAFVRGDVPADLADFDDWVRRTVLDPGVPIFREARYLLAEETVVRDPALYNSVLGAIAVGNTTRGGIASYVGRKDSDLAHPLNVLEDSGLIVRESDPFHSRRSAFRIAEPLIVFYEAVMRRSWTLLEQRQAAAVWQNAQSAFLSQVVGPHFESLCREYARSYDVPFLGMPGEVSAGVIPDPANRTQIQVDVVVLAPGLPGERRAILSLGEAKWGKVMGTRHLNRLRRARDLLAARGYETANTVLACYGGSGFEEELRAVADREGAHLVGLGALYGA